MCAVLLLKLDAQSLEQNHKIPFVSEWFEVYSNKLYIGKSKSKSSASSIVVSSIFMIHLVNGAQFLNASCVVRAATRVISPLTKM